MTDDMDAVKDYFELFRQDPPYPFGVSDEQMTDVLRKAVSEGEPIPDDYDWWGYLPDGADA